MSFTQVGKSKYWAKDEGRPLFSILFDFQHFFYR